MKAGRKPVPRNLRLVRGSRRATLAGDSEPVVPVIAPEPPEHLTEVEAEKFRETAALLAKMRIMSEADVDALALYATTWVRYLAATDKVRELGMIVKSPKDYPMQNPFLSIANRAQKDCMSILSEFGLTPSSRTRVQKS